MRTNNETTNDELWLVVDRDRRETTKITPREDGK
jgi:hypothetical protein